MGRFRVTRAEAGPRGPRGRQPVGTGAVDDLTDRPLDSASIATLQRLAGNHAVADLIADRIPVQRDQAADGGGGSTPALDFDTLDMPAGSGVPTLDGVVTATPDGAGSVYIDGPTVRMDPVSVSIKPGVTLGTGKTILYGPVQSVVSSVRIAQYKSPGAGSTDAPIEMKNELGASLDQAYLLGSGGKKFGAGQAPFYLAPRTLSDVHTEDTLTVATGEGAGVLDKPGWPAPGTIGSGMFAPQLVGTAGEDRFLTSVAAKYAGDSNLFHLSSTHWEVPWTVSALDAYRGGTGGAGTSGVATGVPPKTEGEIAVAQQGKNWISFPTVADAMLLPATTLLANLNPARDNDPASFEYTAQALMQKNPALHIELDCDTTFANIGTDTVTVDVKGSAPGPTASFRLDNGDLRSLTFHLADLMDLAALKAGQPIGVEINVVSSLGSHAPPTTRTWAFPYLKLVDSFGIADGKYALKAWVS
jgi:hypothetical protein